MITRVSLFVEIPMLFYRIKAAESISKGNLNLLKEYEPFADFNYKCGDPLNDLDIPLAQSYMEAA